MQINNKNIRVDIPFQTDPFLFSSKAMVEMDKSLSVYSIIASFVRKAEQWYGLLGMYSSVCYRINGTLSFLPSFISPGYTLYKDVGSSEATSCIFVKWLKRIGWDIDLVAVLLNGPATFTESELKMDWIMNSVNFQSRLRRNFSGSVNFQAVFSSDSVNVAGPLSKTATKSMSQPIL